MTITSASSVSVRTAKSGGLEGIEVADTVLSDVDGERGRLVLRGHDIEAVAGTLPFEATLGLLWNGTVPDADEMARIRTALGHARARAFDRVAEDKLVLSMRDGMDALRASVAALSVSDDSFESSVAVVGAFAVFVAAWSRLSRGLAPVAPDPALGHAADYLRMLSNHVPGDAETAGMDAYLSTVIDHGMNASTFTARVIASTGSDLVSCVVGGIGALKGPLHGGAPGPVLDMLDAIGDATRAESWLLTETAAGRRIMGMGHRVYRVRDPRAAVLERAVEKLERAGITTGRLPLARAVERAAVGVLATKYPERSLAANVEFYTAVILDVLGVPREAFTPTFAVSRVVGWIAHVREQRATGRLIRPSSRYVGPMPDARQ